MKLDHLLYFFKAIYKLKDRNNIEVLIREFFRVFR